MECAGERQPLLNENRSTSSFFSVFILFYLFIYLFIYYYFYFFLFFMNGRYRKVGLVSLGYLFFLFLFEKKVLNIRILLNNKMCIQIIIFFMGWKLKWVLFNCEFLYTTIIFINQKKAKRKEWGFSFSIPNKWKS